MIQVFDSQSTYNSRLFWIDNAIELDSEECQVVFFLMKTKLESSQGWYEMIRIRL